MKKFKIGDRVKYTYNGHVGTILTFDPSDSTYGIEFDTRFQGCHSLNNKCPKYNGCWLPANNLELITEAPKEFTLGDLRDGYLVETKNGKRYIVMTVKDGTVKIFIRNGVFYIYLDECTGDYTIVKVYGYTSLYGEALEFETENRPLLWERKEETKSEPKKLTVAEIEKELGYSVEIISEDK